MFTLSRTTSRAPHLIAAASVMILALSAPGIAPSAYASGGKGFTYGLYGHDPSLGVDNVGIFGTGNPYTGDTNCRIKRPILCVNVDGSPRPNYNVSPGYEMYNGWVEGHYTTTVPTKGTALQSQAHADSLCAAAFGTGWRMAEFHDGAYINGMDSTHYGNSIGSQSPWQSGAPHGGHTAWGFGHVRNDTRYWVAINDQPGNCWNP